MGKRKKKKLIFIIVLIMSLILISLGIYILFIRNKDEINNNELVIVDKKTFNDYEYKDSFQDYLFVVKDNKLGVIDKLGNVKIDFIYMEPATIFTYKNAFVINSLEEYYLYDKNLNLLDSSKDYIGVLNDVTSDEVFYRKDKTIYNAKGEKIIDVNSDYFEKIGNYIFTDTEIINLLNNEKIKISYFIIDNEKIYALSKNEKDLYLYDLTKNELNKYNILEFFSNGFVIQDEDGKEYSYSYYNGLIDKLGEANVLDYHFSYNECSYGFKIYDKNEKLLSNNCFENYIVDDNTLNIELKLEDKSYVLVNNQIKEIENNSILVGNYVINTKENSNVLDVYDFDGNKVDNSCYLSLDYLNNDMYACSDGAKSYLIDNNFKKKTSSYDELRCFPDSSYCIFKKDKKYGLLKDGEEVIKAVYNNMQINYDNKEIIGEGLWNFDVYYLDKSEDNKKVDLKVEFAKPYNQINIDDIISKYNLSKIKDIINDNSELFKKYAYIVENNNNLGEYKDRVLASFYEIALNKKYLDEDYLLKSLRRLNITKKDTLGEEYLGFYYDDEKKIELASNIDNVVYHELTHFIDYSFSSTISNNIYACNDKYLSDNEFSELNVLEASDCELVVTSEPNFIIEGGAEYYSGYYLNNKTLRTYQMQTNIIGALSYLLGFDTLNKIYFDGDNGSLQLFKIFNSAGINIDDYNNFLDITNRLYKMSNKDIFVITDTLIKIYESKKDTPWYEDKEFREIITLLIGFNKISKSYTERYDEYQKLNYDFYHKYEDILGDENKFLIGPCSYIKGSDGTYLIFNLYDDNLYYKVVKYDFINDKVLDSFIVNE